MVKCTDVSKEFINVQPFVPYFVHESFPFWYTVRAEHRQLNKMSS